MTTTPTNPLAAANDVLMGQSSAPAARFQNPGDSVSGTITAVSTYQEREYNRVTRRSDGEPKYFPSGDPIMGVAVTLQTGMRDPSVDDDDGARRIYVQGKRLKNAVREAIATAGASGLENGASLTVTFTGVEGEMDAKCYTARYAPAAHAVASAAVMGQPAAEPQQPAPQSVAATPQAAAEPPAEQVAALKAAGVDPRTVLGAQYPQWAAAQG